MEFIKQLWSNKKWKVIFTLSILMLFYWFELREEVMAKRCSSYAQEKANEKDNKSLLEKTSIYKAYFEKCVNESVLY